MRVSTDFSRSAFADFDCAAVIDILRRRTTTLGKQNVADIFSVVYNACCVFVSIISRRPTPPVCLSISNARSGYFSAVWKEIIAFNYLQETEVRYFGVV